VLIAILAFVLVEALELGKTIDEVAHRYETWPIMQFVTVPVILSLAFGFYSLRRWKELRHEIIRRSKLEKILDRKQKNLEATFDAVPVGMLLVDENMIVRRVNDAIRQMVHRKYPEIINQPVGGALGCVNSTYNEKACGYSTACAACSLLKTIKSVLDSEQSAHGVEYQPTLKVGNKEIRPWLCISAEPAMIDGHKHVVIAVTDITNRKNTEEKLKETMEIKSQFISTVSHELRSPLASIKEGVSIILDEVLGEINNKQRNFLNIAKRNADRLARLINDVLDFFLRYLKSSFVNY